MAKASNPQPASAYDTWLSRLTPSARKSMTAVSKTTQRPNDDEKQDYGLWRSGLGEKAKDWIDGQAAPSVPDQEDDMESARYGCVECLGGEFPVVRLFKSNESLARHIGKLEGKDVNVVAFYGHFFRLSVGPTRYLQLPDAETLLVIPRDGLGAVHRIDADLVSFEWQEDGFVGPAELADSSALEAELEKSAAEYKQPKIVPQVEYDGDDEEDEEEDE